MAKAFDRGNIFCKLCGIWLHALILILRGHLFIMLLQTKMSVKAPMIVTLMVHASMSRLDPTLVLVRLAMKVLASTVLVSVMN